MRRISQKKAGKYCCSSTVDAENQRMLMQTRNSYIIYCTPSAVRRIDWAFPSYPPRFRSPISPTPVYRVAFARQSID